MNLVLKLLVGAVAVGITAAVLPGVAVNGAAAAVFVTVILAAANTFIKPILWLLTLPINILTLGLFTFVINALIIMLVDWMIGGFMVNNFWWALLFGLILSMVSSVLNNMLREHRI